MYALWFHLHTDSSKYLQTIISRLSKKHQTESFVPHLTLAGHINKPYDTVASVVQQRVADQRRMIVYGDTVEYSTTYYQCIFLKIRPTVELLQMYTKTVPALELNPHAPYWPHISLVYGDMNIETREKITKEIDLQPVPIPIEGIDIIEIGTDGQMWGADKWKGRDSYKFMDCS